jgi:hypothetical protein
VEYWQQLNGLNKTGIFNCGQDTCGVDRVDLSFLQENERLGQRFDAGPLIRTLEAEERARNEREAAERAAHQAWLNAINAANSGGSDQSRPIDWWILENQFLCKGVTDQPDMVGHLQWRLSLLGFGNMIGSNGDYTRVYDDATVANVHWWRHMRGLGTEANPGCFDASSMLGHMKNDVASGWRFDPAPLQAFFNPPAPAPAPVPPAAPPAPAPAPAPGSVASKSTAAAPPAVAVTVAMNTREQQQRELAEALGGMGFSQNTKAECVVWFKAGLYSARYEEFHRDGTNAYECLAFAAELSNTYKIDGTTIFTKHHIDWPRNNTVYNYNPF